MSWTIVSGGQTGVDRAALDIALVLGLPCGGWCPQHRRAEDGRVPDTYPLRETPSAAYPQRTEWNVRDADATLVLHRGPLGRGTALTGRLARALGKPLKSVDLATSDDSAGVRQWLEEGGFRVLNVAGPRESERPGIHDAARRFLMRVLGPAEADQLS